MSTDIAVLDAELAKEAQNIKKQIAAPSSPKLTISKTGSWTTPDGQELDTEIRGVVVDFVSSNKFYDRQYDPNTPISPACFAIGTVLADMRPSKDAPAPQAETCGECPHNQFGSRGNGKACKNTREIAFLLESDFDNPDAQLYLISVPPTGLKSFDGFVNAVARLFDGPPLKAIVTVKAVGVGTYFTLAFVDIQPNADYKDFVGLRGEAHELVSREPDASNYTPPATKPAPRPAPRR